MSAPGNARFACQAIISWIGNFKIKNYACGRYAVRAAGSLSAYKSAPGSDC